MMAADRRRRDAALSRSKHGEHVEIELASRSLREEKETRTLEGRREKRVIRRSPIALRLHVLTGLAVNSSIAGDSSIKGHLGARPDGIAGSRQATQTQCQVMDEHFDINGKQVIDDLHSCPQAAIRPGDSWGS